MVEQYYKSKDGNKKLSTNFTVKEFACKDGSDYLLVNTALVALLQKVRDHFGKPITINSAYRNVAYNKKVGGASNSQHVLGYAADIVVKGVAPKEVATYVESIMPNSGGIGEYGGCKGEFTHIDTRTKRSRWQNFGREVSVKGFYSESMSENANYKIIGKTHVVEVSPDKIWAVETQCVTNKTPYDNFVNSIFFMAQANGIMHPQGIMVNAGQVICNNPTHGKPVATLIVHSKDNVEMKYVSDITKEKDVWFAVSGFGIYPNITAMQEGFMDKFSDVLRACNRPIIGYRKRDNKIIIAVRSGTTAERAKQTAQNLGLDFAISLDGGGSATLKVGGKYKFKGDGRKLYGGIIWA